MFTGNVKNDALRLFHTLRYLKFHQIYSRIKKSLRKPKIKHYLIPVLREATAKFTTPLLKEITFTHQNTICLLNKEIDITHPSIWIDSRLDKLWLYHLHYFDILNNIENDTQNARKKKLIYRWINDNPFYTINAWEPYTISLRIVNWIKWIIQHQENDEIIIHSLAVQIRFLYSNLETHILGNHLLANAKALIFAGIFFKGNEAKRWYKRGLYYYNRELKEQILADGGHFELSPMYQAILYEDLLDLINLFQTFQIPIPEHWYAINNKMFLWLQVMHHPDAKIAFFNDATFGTSPTLKDLMRYRSKLGLKPLSMPSTPLVELKESGYLRIKQFPITLFIDVADITASYQPGHSHADSLSFELSIDTQRVFVNSGISTYNECDERLKQRGTGAHNSIVINNKNSTEIWKSFRVGRRARILHKSIQTHPDHMHIQASHDGYKKSFNIIHTRTWKIFAERCIIEDVIAGNSSAHIQSIFHLHPCIMVKQINKRTIELLNKDVRICLFHSSEKISIQDSTFYPGFNLMESNKKIVIAKNYSLPLHLKTCIKWNI